MADLSLLDKTSIKAGKYFEISFFLPLKEKVDSYLIKVMSDWYIDADSYYELPLTNMRVESDAGNMVHSVNI